MKLRFQADANFNNLILRAVLRREPTIDFQPAHLANLVSLSDDEVLNLSSKLGRLLVTHDRKTMPHHFARFITSSSSAGVLIVPQKMPIAEVTETLILLWSETEAEEWINRIYCI